MEKYIELKEIIEKFLEMIKNLRERKNLQESRNIPLTDYLNVINCIIYDDIKKFPKIFKEEIKKEIKRWSKYGSYAKENSIFDYWFVSSDWNNRVKKEELILINKKVDKFLKDIWQISTEIIENKIYPFEDSE